MSRPLEIKRVLLRKKEVIALTGLSAVTIWRYTRAGKFPQPVRLSSNRSAFFADEIECWLNEKRLVRA